MTKNSALEKNEKKEERNINKRNTNKWNKTNIKYWHEIQYVHYK